MDAEFFQVVPVDLYEEIIQQHLADRRDRIPVNCNRVTISPEFLARIPQIAREMYVRMSDEEVRAYRMFNNVSLRSARPLSGSLRSATTSPHHEEFRNLIAEVSDFLLSPSANAAGMIASC